MGPSSPRPIESWGRPDDTVLRESRETDGTNGVRDEVEESTGSGDVHAVGGKTVHDGTMACSRTP